MEALFIVALRALQKLAMDQTDGTGKQNTQQIEIVILKPISGTHIEHHWDSGISSV
jgi:hypothetical protein